MRPCVALVAVLALGIGTAACQRTGPERIETPPNNGATIGFRLAGPNQAAMLVPVHVNGQGPYDFVLDTGATLTCVDDALAQTLGLDETRRPAVGAGIGGAGPMRLVRIDSLRLGDTTAHGLMGCALDLDQLRRIPGLDVHGLVGLNFLREFRVTIDFGESLLVLEPS